MTVPCSQHLGVGLHSKWQFLYLGGAYDAATYAARIIVDAATGMKSKAGCVDFHGWDHILTCRFVD
jgi:hypothetical protein